MSGDKEVNLFTDIFVEKHEFKIGWYSKLMLSFKYVFKAIFFGFICSLILLAGAYFVFDLKVTFTFNTLINVLVGNLVGVFIVYGIKKLAKND